MKYLALALASVVSHNVLNLLLFVDCWLMLLIYLVFVTQYYMNTALLQVVRCSVVSAHRMVA